VTRFIRCELCNVKIAGDKCELAAHTKMINGKEHTFCCETCAQHYEKKRNG
jgi:YHS domain-containing protein